MFTRKRDEIDDEIPMWVWFLILPGVVIVTALLLRRLRSQMQLPQAQPEDAQEFRLEASRRNMPQTAERTRFEAEAEDTGEIAGPVNRMSTVEAGQSSADIAEMKSSTIREEAEVAHTASNKAGPGDDLKVIEGVGPRIEAILKQAGINTFKELAGTSVERLYQVLHEADLRLADPNTWPEQARLAANENWDFLKALQDRTKAGRRFIED